MKKILSIFFISFIVLSFLPSETFAATCSVAANTCNESCVDSTGKGIINGTMNPTTGAITGGNETPITGTRSGLVPCGNTCRNAVNGQSVDCNTCYNSITGTTIACSTPPNSLPNNAKVARASSALFCRCELYHVFVLALTLYTFIIWDIATPIAGLMIIFGGVLLLISGITPKWHEIGKNMLWGAAIGLGFIFGSWLIIDIVLKAIGYTGAWFNF